MSDCLFSPIALGAITLSNRIVMAPMTRDRAGPDDVPGDMMEPAAKLQRVVRGLAVILSLGLGLVFTLGMLAVDAANGLWVYRLIASNGTQAQRASRALTCAIALLSLGLAGSWQIHRHLPFQLRGVKRHHEVEEQLKRHVEHGLEHHLAEPSV